MQYPGPNGRETPDRQSEDEIAQEKLGGTRGMPEAAPAPMTPQREKKTLLEPGE